MWCVTLARPHAVASIQELLYRPGVNLRIKWEDESKCAIGAVLLQQQDEENPKERVLVGYWSKAITQLETNCSTTERECFSMLWALKTLHLYLEGTNCTVRTDHNALQWMLNISDPYSRLSRQRLTLAEFSFTVTYRSSRVHQVPSALSRLLSPDNPSAAVDTDLPCFSDSVLATTRSSARAGEPNTLDNESQTNDETDKEPLFGELGNFDLIFPPERPKRLRAVNLETYRIP